MPAVMKSPMTPGTTTGRRSSPTNGQGTRYGGAAPRTACGSAMSTLSTRLVVGPPAPPGAGEGVARLEAPRHGGLDSWAGRLGGSTCARALEYEYSY